MSHNVKKVYHKVFTELNNCLKLGELGSEYSLVYYEFLRMCNNASTAIVLSRIFYWWRVDGDGKTKLRKQIRSGIHARKYAIAKSAKEMSLETGVPESTVKRAYTELRNLGLIITVNQSLNDHNTTHIILDEAKFTLEFLKACKQKFSDKSHYSKNNDDCSEHDENFEKRLNAIILDLEEQISKRSMEDINKPSIMINDFPKNENTPVDATNTAKSTPKKEVVRKKVV